MGWIWATASPFCRDGALFVADLPLRNRLYFHDLAFQLRAPALHQTTCKGGPLQHFEVTGFAEVAKSGQSKSIDSSSWRRVYRVRGRIAQHGLHF